MDEYRIPTQNAEDAFVEKRSRFIGHVFHTETEEEALALLKQTREQHWDANHNVYAYIIKDGPTRYSDDSEPQGTAGMPVLEVLRREEVYNVLCVVTRYFGGVLLGAGGLVRAYAKAAKLGLDAAGLSMKRVWDSVEIPCPYNLFDRVKLELDGFEGLLQDTEYGADVTLHAMFPAARTADFLARLTGVTAGRVSGCVTGQAYRAFPLQK